MQEYSCHYKMSSIPPPPPPPLPPVLDVASKSLSSKNFAGNQIDLKGIFHENIFSTVEEQAKKACRWFIKDNGLTEDQVSDFVFISNYQPVKPIIQNGPLCGMVALAMATELTGGKVVSTEDIFDEAKKCGFSLQGEMFSASFMQDLAVKFLDCDVKTILLTPTDHTNVMEASTVIIKALLQNYLILLPYDADKNHGPCQAKGHKAHWALITGFYAALKKDGFNTDVLSSLIQDREIKSLYYWDNSRKFDNKDLSNYLSENSEFKLYIHQGKSKYCGTWNLQDMLKSNSNLIEVGSDRDSEQYLLPPGGVKEGLQCKAVFICPRKR